jgi:hypothetical protein
MAEKPNSECPIDCPNRRKSGLIISFRNKTIYLDPFEMILWLLLLTIPVGTTIRDAWINGIAFEEGLKRIGAIAAIGFAIRNSPTEKAYEYLFGMKVNKHSDNSDNKD